MPEQDGYSMQYDAQGRPFFWVNGKVGGAKRYVSPVSFGEKPPEDTTGIFRKGPQWNAEKGKFETPIDWGNIANIGVGSALGLGGLHAAGAFGGAAGGAGGAAGTLGPSTPANIAATTAAITPPASLLAGGTATAGGGILSKILKGLIDPRTLTALGIGAGVPLAMKAFGGGDDSGGGNDFLTPDMQRYQAMSEARFRRTDPLHEAVSQLAFQRMPIQGREGLSLPRVPLPPQG